MCFVSGRRHRVLVRGPPLPLESSEHYRAFQALEHPCIAARKHRRGSYFDPMIVTKMYKFSSQNLVKRSLFHCLVELLCKQLAEEGGDMAGVSWL